MIISIYMHNDDDDDDYNIVNLMITILSGACILRRVVESRPKTPAPPHSQSDLSN